MYVGWQDSFKNKDTLTTISTRQGCRPEGVHEEMHHKKTKKLVILLFYHTIEYLSDKEVSPCIELD